MFGHVDFQLAPPSVRSLVDRHNEGAASFEEEVEGWLAWETLAMAILAVVMVLLSVGRVLMCANGGPKGGIGSLILRGTMFNPIVVAIVLGAALAGTGLALPEAITRFLGGAAGPAALFALGGALSLPRLDRRIALAACLITVARLAVYAMLVWLILGRMMHLDAIWVNVGVLTACLPSAVGREYLCSRPAV